MEYRPLDITVISAEGLKDVNLISKMDVYVEVSIGGDPLGKRKTHVDKDGGKSPKWNHRLKFAVDVAALSLLFKIRSDRPLGDKDIGYVSIPIKELLDAASSSADGSGGERVVVYQVRTPSGKPKGTLKFSYMFGDKLAAPAEAAPPKSKNTGEAVTAYPAPAHPGPSACYPPPPGVWYAQPYMAGYAQPQPGYGYPLPPATGYAGYPPQQPGYGYAPPPPGYGYPPPQTAVQQPKMKKNSKFGLGLAGGLLGGLLVGDMISDVGEMAAYDAGYDTGFDF